ncbi:hypothetical protein O181_045041 [Austropuccinia psidii MF-1]|uniref:Carboxypeptidase n=1 Tax=Austropuccinia psidii MF-1 TaxID=1389203 RepID=A0A9Q3DRK2_9BASI|nr:hypothetical protein [Austropuccinia psidii MF-1]
MIPFFDSDNPGGLWILRIAKRETASEFKDNFYQYSCTNRLSDKSNACPETSASPKVSTSTDLQYGVVVNNTLGVCQSRLPDGLWGRMRHEAGKMYPIIQSDRRLASFHHPKTKAPLLRMQKHSVTHLPTWIPSIASWILGSAMIFSNNLTILLSVSLWLCSSFSAQNLASKPQGTLISGKSPKGSYRFIANSKICETTPGVQSYSGYVETGFHRSTFFWFFEARNNPKTAPFSVWINGGPGCSALIGLFQENGPCTVEGNVTKLNPYSWNTYANMLYLDQPIGTGFSYGIRDVHSSAQAAPHVWDFLQILFGTSNFAKYQSHHFTLWTESYGGHYAPKFAEYFQSQNALIASGQLTARQIVLTSLGINNGWFSPYIQYQSYYDYAQAKGNKMFDFVDQTTLQKVHTDLTKEGGCLSQLKQCDAHGDNLVCRDADRFCGQYVTVPLVGDRNPYYFIRDQNDTFPSETFLGYLARPDIMRAIGAESNYVECSEAVGNDFTTTGDDARSTLPSLAKVLNTGLRTIIWAGDKDFLCNTLGGYRSIESMEWKYSDAFRKAEWKQLSIAGEIVGIFKSAGPLTYLTVFDAGHEVAAYKPALSLEVFRQTIFGESLHNIKN